jgi:rsbT co-antagonist protein RsbR
MPTAATRVPELLAKHQADLLEQWTRLQLAAGTRRPDLLTEEDLRAQCRAFLSALTRALQHGGGVTEVDTAPHWAETREMLESLSARRARVGFSASETAMFIFSLKEPVFTRLRQELEKDPRALADEMWAITVILDKLGLLTAEAFLKAREGVIRRQQAELMELSTPVVKLWEGILAVPLIGTLDSSRTQVVMESLLQEIVDTGSSIAIIDITGVATVDTLVAQHLLKTVAAARLMGADCIISGVRPQIAQTIVHLGVNLGDVVTKPSLALALALAFKRTGLAVARAAS